MAEQTTNKYEIHCPVDFTFKGKFYGRGTHQLDNEKDFEMFSSQIQRWHDIQERKQKLNQQASDRANPGATVQQNMQASQIEKIVKEAVETASTPLLERIAELEKEQAEGTGVTESEEIQEETTDANSEEESEKEKPTETEKPKAPKPKAKKKVTLKK